MKKYNNILSDIKNLEIEVVINVIFNLINNLYILHNNNIIHRDIKPDNILWNNEYDVKFIDFGLAQLGCYKSKICEKLNYNVYTDYWRPPEVRNKLKYNKKADVFALGLVFIEFILKTMNNHTHNNKTIYKLIMEYTCDYLDKARYITNYKLFIKQNLFNNIDINDINENILDLICNMTIPNYKIRYNIGDCINHDLFKEKVIILYNQIHNNYEKLKYCSVSNRINLFKYIHNKYIDYKFSKKTLLNVYLILDNLYYNIYEKKITYEFSSKETCESCIYLALCFDDIKLNMDYDYSLCIIDILIILNYDIYYNNPLDYLLTLYKNSDYVNKEYLLDYTDLIITNYINKKKDNIHDLVNYSILKYNKYKETNYNIL
jgi:serine/threonine protein kinase